MTTLRQRAPHAPYTCATHGCNTGHPGVVPQAELPAGVSACRMPDGVATYGLKVPQETVPLRKREGRQWVTRNVTIFERVLHVGEFASWRALWDLSRRTTHFGNWHGYGPEEWTFGPGMSHTTTRLAMERREVPPWASQTRPNERASATVIQRPRITWGEVGIYADPSRVMAGSERPWRRGSPMAPTCRIYVDLATPHTASHADICKLAERGAAAVRRAVARGERPDVWVALSARENPTSSRAGVLLVRLPARAVERDILTHAWPGFSRYAGARAQCGIGFCFGGSGGGAMGYCGLTPAEKRALPPGEWIETKPGRRAPSGDEERYGDAGIGGVEPDAEEPAENVGAADQGAEANATPPTRAGEPEGADPGTGGGEEPDESESEGEPGEGAESGAGEGEGAESEGPSEGEPGRPTEGEGEGAENDRSDAPAPGSESESEGTGERPPSLNVTLPDGRVVTAEWDRMRAAWVVRSD